MELKFWVITHTGLMTSVNIEVILTMNAMTSTLERNDQKTHCRTLLPKNPRKNPNFITGPALIPAPKSTTIYHTIDDAIIFMNMNYPNRITLPTSKRFLLNVCMPMLKDSVRVKFC